MCGIVGLISGPEGSPDQIERMVDPLTHRGPDDRGTWIGRQAGVAFGHRRLAIIDLSPHGHQPMHSADGRWVITYNGEIYNHRELRLELEQAGKAPPGGWRGHSDPETLIEAIANWGLEAALARATGMFAFGLWDRKERELHLARDRFGEKPLYYGWVGGDFVFASELKSLTAHTRFDNDVSADALQAFVSRTHVPAPLSIYRRLFKLQPGCILRVGHGAPATPLESSPVEGMSQGGVRLTRYWSYGDVLSRGLADPIDDEEAAIGALEGALAQSIKGQSLADVPVGAFLSGGTDSSTIVALYQKHSSVPVRTFTIGFEDEHFNEAENARAVAQHLGTVHEERYVTAREAADVIPLLPNMFDEPFGDSSQIPTYLVSKFARQRVTVALSGDGGDELFAGYLRHTEALALWNTLRLIPVGVRAAAARTLGRIPQQAWTTTASILGASRRRPLSGKIQKGLKVGASVGSFDDLYSSFLEQWAFEEPPLVNPGGRATPFPLDPGFQASNAIKMGYCDASAYLPDDILCKVDRASMAVSLESRVPFLDHRVAEVAARIPMSMKMRGKRGKWILRELLGRHLPTELVDRPKTGFAMPVGEWLRGDLRDWAEDLLDPSAMRQQGYFDTTRVQQRWQEHLARRRDSASAIWAILMFQSWLRNSKQGGLSAAIPHHAA
ncbi:asparagine synthase (glutamine-hydrolyzing) [Sphingomonas sp. F9_3S_D5_B_2]